MSDFLSNLMARSLGVAGVVSPRVPSLYEPYRRDGNPTPGRPRLSPSEPNPVREGEDAFESDRESADNSPHRAATPYVLASRLAKAHPDAQLSAQFNERTPETASVNRPGKPASRVFQQKQSETESRDRNLPVANPVTNAERVTQSLHKQRQNSAESSVRPVHMEHVEAQPAVAPVNAEFNPAAEQSQLRPAPFGEGIQPGEPSASSAPKTFLPLEPEAGISPRATLPKPALSGDLLDVLGIARRFQEGSAVSPAQLEPRLIRPPAQPASGPRKFPDAGSGADAVPPIKVTIGRVEVRAVHPEAPVRRAPAPRARPTVSLDDYLKRGGESKR